MSTPPPVTDAELARSAYEEPALVALGRDAAAWRAWAVAHGQKAFRGDQVFGWIQRKGVYDPRQMTDLPEPLREALVAEGVAAPFTVQGVHRSSDGTRKLVMALRDEGRIECVLIPMTNDPRDAEGGDSEDLVEEAPSSQRRVTLCVSTQYGCAMGCAFCASGRVGLLRGLTSAEIVAQVVESKRHLDPEEELRNLVFMGMGEPLHHYERTAAAIRLLTDAKGLDMSPRRITVSTVGLVPGIRRLGEDFEGKVGLAVSLHAPNDELRSRIMPMNRRYPLAELMAALHAYPLPRRRRITIEYALLGGVNDSLQHARQLVNLLRGLRVKVNLIPYNPVEGAPFVTPSPAVVAAFRDAVADSGVSCFLRARRGDDVSAACGQLALKPRGEEPAGLG